ncbi:MAG: lytic transglycosylase domain-containing protein [Pseudomonadota bacterium]
MSTCRPLALALLLGLAAAFSAVDAAASPCDDAIRRVERETELPAGLLRAIGLVESGRTTDAGYAPWPWTVNSPEGGTYLDSRSAALARIEALQGRGHRNIDVGCMQINLRFHPDAFATLEQALDPLANVRYAASFLQALKHETGTWQGAIGRYHSATPDLARAYRERVAGRWDRTPPAPVEVAEAPPSRTDRDPALGGVMARSLAPAAGGVRLAETTPQRAAHGAIPLVARHVRPAAFAPASRETDPASLGTFTGR